MAVELPEGFSFQDKYQGLYASGQLTDPASFGFDPKSINFGPGTGPDLLDAAGTPWMARDANPLWGDQAKLINGTTYVPRSLGTSPAVTNNLPGFKDELRGLMYPAAAAAIAGGLNFAGVPIDGATAAAAAPTAISAPAAASFGEFNPYALTGPATTGAEGGLATGAEYGADMLTGPATTGLGAPSLGAPFQSGYNYLDPSTYGGAGNTPLNPAAGGAGADTAQAAINSNFPMTSNFIPATNLMSPLGTAADQFGITAPASAGGGIATGGPGLPGMSDLSGVAQGVSNASTADDIMEKIKKGGGNAMDWITKNPASAAMLGISAANALSKPKLPEAAQTVQKVNTPNATASSGVVNAGGASGPAWNTQKAAIDSAIDRQIAEKKQQILQQAANTGMGVDSLVTIQQIQKMTEQLEGVRQQQYMQAQGQNVQAALSELGMSNQALGQVAQQQFSTSKDAQSSAMQTAQLALMLQQLQKPTANQPQPNANG